MPDRRSHPSHPERRWPQRSANDRQGRRHRAGRRPRAGLPRSVPRRLWRQPALPVFPRTRPAVAPATRGERALTPTTPLTRRSCFPCCNSRSGCVCGRTTPTPTPSSSGRPRGRRRRPRRPPPSGHALRAAAATRHPLLPAQLVGRGRHNSVGMAPVPPARSRAARAVGGRRLARHHGAPPEPLAASAPRARAAQRRPGVRRGRRPGRA